MKINQKVKYGVACLFELSKYAPEYYDADSIAEKQNIPSAYAQKILQALAHAGLVRAMKGVGYALARPLSEITALDVMEALTVEIEINITNPMVGSMLEKRVNQALGSFSLAELVAR